MGSFPEVSFSASSTPNLNKSIHEVDLSRTEFAPIEKFTNDTPSEIFNDTKYYKTALTGENQSAQRVHQILSGNSHYNSNYLKNKRTRTK